jgi:RHS repeat-associated protein
MIQLISVPLGHTTYMLYNDNGKLIETVLPDSTLNNLLDNPRTKNIYDLLGRIIATIDAVGYSTHMIYDSAGKVIEIIQPDSTPNNLIDNPRVKREYYTDGLIKASVDQLGHRTEYRYDALGRQLSTIYPDITPNDLTDNPTNHIVYNEVGEITKEIDPLGHITTYQYDDLGHLISTTFADGTQISNEYDKVGNKIAEVDQIGTKTQYKYDAFGRIQEVVNTLNSTTRYEYDKIGRLISTIDAESHKTSYEYDRLGRKIATILPEGQRSTSSYDAVGNLTTSTDFNGRVIRFVYDSQNRTTDKIFQDGSEVKYTYTFDGLLDLTKILDSNGQIVSIYDQDYDELKRLTKRTDTINGISLAVNHSYDLAGNRISVSTPSNTTYYTYDEQDRLKSVTDSTSGVTTYVYDKDSNLVQTVLSNGVIETRIYDELNRLTDLVNKKSDGITISGYHYTLDKVGNRIKVNEESGRTVEYKYDEQYRLVNETVKDIISGNHKYAFTYDKVGNRLTQSRDSVITSYKYDFNDRLLTETISDQVVASYIYDNNGSLLSKQEIGKSTRYDWDDSKRLIHAQIMDLNNISNFSYQYDDNGIRVESTNGNQVSRYLLDTVKIDNQVLCEFINGNLQVSYIHGNDLISQTRLNTTSNYLIDGIGSVRFISDNQQNVTNSYDYEAFGKLLSSTGVSENDYLFAGEQFDNNLSAYYLRERYYSFEIGRFLRRDTYDGQLIDPNTIHKYSYTSNNPVNKVDPSGLYTGNFGRAVEDAVQPFYTADHLGDNIDYGQLARPNGPNRPHINIKPDILNYTRKLYNDIKPLSPGGVSGAALQMATYYLTLQQYSRYIPDVNWHSPPNILTVPLNSRGISGTNVIVFNVGGVLFYTDQQNLQVTIAALSFKSYEEGVQKLRPLLITAGRSAVNPIANVLYIASTAFAISYAINSADIALAAFARF